MPQVATENFAVELDGEQEKFLKGISRVDSDHEIVRRYPSRFAPESSSAGIAAIRSASRRSASNRTVTRGLNRDGSPTSDRERRIERIRELAKNPANLEAGTDFGPDTRKRSGDPDRDSALRAVESRADVLSSEAGDHAVELIARDTFGADRRYIAAISNPNYATAFARKLLMPDNGPHALLSGAEAEALQAVSRSMQERSLLSGDGPSGGFALPISVDPTLTLTTDGTINPLREVANVRTLTSAELRLVTSEGTSASFAPEGDEVGDGTPELGQPVLRPERAHAFVPFSFEVAQDWASLSQELVRLFQDARDQLEAEKFTHGDGAGVNEPEGLVSSLDDSDSIVYTDDDDVALADLYKVAEALPPRFSPRASWLTSLAVANRIDQQAGPGSEHPGAFDAQTDRILRKPWRELSTLSSTVETGESIAVYGDLKAAFTIADRIGLTVSKVDHLFGAEGRPRGVAGLYAWWRTTSQVVVPNAVRLLRVGPSGSGS